MELDGIETAEKILAFRPIPGIYLTAYAGSKVISRIQASGAFSFLEKPFEENTLLEILRSVLE